MKKLLILSILTTILLPSSLVFANNETTTPDTCTFPSTGQRVAIKDNTNTTIQFNNCKAQQTQTASQCETLIKESSEYQEILNSKPSQQKTNQLQNADLVIQKCQLSIENTLQSNQKKQTSLSTVSDIIETSGNCITNDPNVLNLQTNPECNITTSTSPQTENLQLLQDIFNNNFVYQLIDPITDENLVIQQRTCTFEFMRNKDGLLQVAGLEGNQTTLEERQEDNFYAQKEFIITENQCFVTYVEQCQPNLILDATISFNEELPVSNYCKTYQVIYGNSGTDFIKRFVNIIYRLAVGIVGVIAVIVIIVNGIRISTAGDDSGVISDAKERIGQSLFGLAVLFLAWIILRSVNPNFFSSNVEIENPRTTTETEASQDNTNQES